MDESRPTISLAVAVPLTPAAAFDTLVGELATALAQQDIGLEMTPDGRVIEGEREVGHILTWQPGELVRPRFHPSDWTGGEAAEIEIRCAPVKAGTRIELQLHPWPTLLGDAGFARAQVVLRDLEPFARQAGVPEEHLALFAGPGARFLLAEKD